MRFSPSVTLLGYIYRIFLHAHILCTVSLLVREYASNTKWQSLSGLRMVQANLNFASFKSVGNAQLVLSSSTRRQTSALGFQPSTCMTPSEQYYALVCLYSCAYNHVLWFWPWLQTIQTKFIRMIIMTLVSKEQQELNSSVCTMKLRPCSNLAR